MVAPCYGCAVGDYDILEYNGSTWQTVTNPTDNMLNGVAVTPGGESWAVGGSGTILHNTGSGWQNVPSPTGYQLYSVAIASDGEAWAVGMRARSCTTPALEPRRRRARRLCLQPSLRQPARRLRHQRGRPGPRQRRRGSTSKVRTCRC